MEQFYTSYFFSGSRVTPIGLATEIQIKWITNNTIRSMEDKGEREQRGH